MKKPKLAAHAKRHTHSPQSTIWIVDFPPTAKKPGARYWATTYAGNGFVYLTTKDRNRPVSKATRLKLIPKVEQAIALAIAAELPLPCEPRDRSGLKALFDAIPPVGDIDEIGGNQCPSLNAPII